MQMDWQIAADVPAGNIIVDEVRDGLARIRQDQRRSVERWFYWRFAVRGAQGRTIRFEFTDWDVIGTRGPCASSDGGRTWRWLGREADSTREGDGPEGPDADERRRPGFSYAFGPSERDVQFCFCLPYLAADLEAFLAERGTGIDRGVLCRSRQGRPVTRLDIGPADAPRRLLLTARHHACESSASFVLEGILDAVARAADGTPPAWLRENVHLAAVPFVDTDGVENGDQGKARDGHDHNRDYIASPRYPETAAIMRLVEGGFCPEVAIDLHSPWIRGPRNEHIYQVGSPEAETWAAQQAFGRVLEDTPPAEATCSPPDGQPAPSREAGGLPYSQGDDLPFGVAWNTAAPSPDACACSKWMSGRGTRLSTSMEIPYANVCERTVTPQRLRAFGHRLAAAVGAYLRDA